MKLRNRLGLSLISIITISSFGMTVNAQVSGGQSNANITFTAPDDGAAAPPVLNPSDPEVLYEPDPEDPTTPQDPVTGETGPLTLDYVSTINFGSREISPTAETYESETLSPFVQVTDRRGTGAGWDVTAQMTDFINEASGSEETLPGSTLTFSGGEVISTTVGGDPTPNNPVELSAGGDAESVVSAGENEGLGSWITRWFPSVEGGLNDNVILDVPAGAATQGDHTAEITWTLYAGPGQGEASEPQA